LKSCKVVFTDFLENYTFSIDLFSHYTTIIGIDSGEGKTWMFDSVSRKQAAGELRVDCEYTISKSVTVMDKINNCRHPYRRFECLYWGIRGKY